MAMSGPSRSGLIVGLLLAVLGLLCLNYTKGFDVDHRAQWAAEHDLPGPSSPIFLAGVSLLALGAGCVGRALGRR